MVKSDDAPIVCGFLSNVRGDFACFEKFVEISRILSWEDESKQSLLLAENAILVYGGNIQGTGIGDIRITKLLLDLKKNCPDRVKLLMGSADVLYLKLADLSDDGLKLLATEFKESFPLGSDDSKSSRVRWILQRLAISEESFENRRSELALLSAESDAKTISDDDVASSFSEQVLPGAEDGLMLQYLSEAQLAYIFEETLFVHGALTERTAGSVPGRSAIARCALSRMPSIPTR
jgi:hypothetical protein